MARLDGRVVIVTGGAKGIGDHYTQALAAEGARVMIGDIADGTELAAELAARHGANSVTSVIADHSGSKLGCTVTLSDGSSFTVRFESGAPGATLQLGAQPAITLSQGVDVLPLLADGSR